MGEAVPSDLLAQAARLTLVEHLNDELALKRPKRLLLRPVRALKHGRREALDRLLARGNVRHDQGFHGAVEPDFREYGRLDVALESDRTGAIVVSDLARDHRPGPVLLQLHLAGEVEAGLGIALVDADRASLKGVTAG